MPVTHFRRPDLAVLTLLFCMLFAPLAQAGNLTIFAAASLSSALTEASEAFEEKTGTKIHLSLASSSSLARQIEAGAPADLFFSANIRWMDYLQEQNLVSKEWQSRALSNQLVLVAPKHLNRQPLSELLQVDLMKLLGEHGKLAMGDPDHVPLGLYGKATLEKTGLWSPLMHHIARTDNARAALALIEQGETPLGILYGTDALLSERLDILYRFDKDIVPIRYAMALTGSEHSEEAKSFFEFLNSQEGREIFTKHGFLLSDAP
ncbi:molybdate ABC transporter substrate-binding protein [Cohaesibacter gelatinilyticus]|uniref:Molybdate-binding protein ModA n=1 Tax=Cohaesibacter gelatinilyticus TaxID=372072 RepID=A0A285PFU4_9HYPH|nr:molybdate ABC transporter substrate-binding protein [Cohaesibacter gelatinilyticus]SNZ19006.1 molybdate transport system substrate-binding protein [Cohaesibacter gelatinilyticus]